MARKASIRFTVAAWVIISGLYAYYYVKSTLALPSLSQGYESDWQFQLLMFCLVRLPILIGGLIAIIAFEIVAFKSGNEWRS